MKKYAFALLLLGATGLSILMSGCVMCKYPIAGDPSCIEETHLASTDITPENIAYSRPAVAKCTDVFKPIFEAGEERVTVIGTGNDLKSATADAISKFMDKTNCDYIVGTTRVVTIKSHPTSRWAATSNYTVKLSGIPVSMTRLEKVIPEEPAPVAAAPVPTLTKDDVKEVVNQVIINQPKPESQCPFGLVKLTDINIKVDAKAVAEDPAGVVFPAKNAK